jgi:hypothetical protein
MIPGVPIAHFNDRGVLVMELPSDATMKQKEAVSDTSITQENMLTKGFLCVSNIQLEGAKLKEQLEHQAPLLENMIGAEESLEAVSTTLRKRRPGPKAPNPLSQRRKKDLPSTGRLSKKELAAQEVAKVESSRGKKRLRDDGEQVVNEEADNQPRRPTSVQVTPDADDVGVSGVAAIVPAVGGENDGAQKKRKRKRRKKAADDSQEGETGGASDLDE